MSLERECQEHYKQDCALNHTHGECCSGVKCMVNENRQKFQLFKEKKRFFLCFVAYFVDLNEAISCHEEHEYEVHG